MMTTEEDRPRRGRRISWREFYKLRPDLKPQNDNSNKSEELNVA